ncbi:MAG TPA: recombinase family protein [Candidatus Paceibacterota bacterium]|nr:recombinase family protein [Candidatus Paceibacterota bacterium]
MKDTATKLQYGTYCRKSTESEDRQVLSLDAQADKAEEIAKSLGAKIKSEHVFSEAKSAKVANHRPRFSDMLHAIERSEIQGIIVWHADRLSRNAMDAALLIDLMDRDKLREIVTPGQTFRNTPIDKFMLSLSCGQAKMENDKKGLDVKRGLEKKAKLGDVPNHAPVGYMNDKHTPRGSKKLLSDPERLPLVRKMWDLMLTGTYTVPQLLNEVNGVWGFRMPNGKKMSRNTLYYLFSNPVYYGMFEYPLKTGNWYRGNHEAIITEEEFDRVQVILGRKGRPRPKTHVFDFVGMMRCGECGAAITAELKFKRPKNGKVHRYVYYHCTKRIKPDCSQGSIEETKLKEQIVAEIDRLEIPPEFHSFAMKWFREQNAKEAQQRNALVQTQQKAYKTCLAKLDGLTDMRAAGEIGPEEYAEKKAKLLAEKKQLDSNYDNTTERVERWANTADEMFAFIEQAKWKLEKGNLEVRRSILAALGSNLTVKNKILSIDTENCLFPVRKISNEVREIHKRFEPIDTKEKQRLFEQTCSQSPTLLGD